MVNILPKRNAIFILSLFIVGLLCFLTVFILYKRRPNYMYDVKKNYVYNFSGINVSKINLYLVDGKIKIPDINDNWDTSIIELSVNSTLLGQIIEPKITLKNCFGIELSQYFEFGARGIRYLNVSQLIGKSKCEIILKSYNIRIDDQPVKLILFKNPKPNTKKILFIAPHPDDIEISAYGLYSSNKDSFIITITAGDDGAKKYDEIYQDDFEHYTEKGRLRVLNSINVPLLGGITPDRAINLGYFDNTLKAMYKNKSSICKPKYSNLIDINFYRKLNISNHLKLKTASSNWVSLIDDLIFLLKEIKPDIIVTPYPAIDSHVDHKLTTVALFEAVKLIHLKKGCLYLYTNHHVFSEAYPYGKIGSVISLPPNFDEEPFLRRIYSYPLSKEKEEKKIFSLEGNNDLRLDTEWLTLLGTIKTATKLINRYLFQYDLSYYRRSIRSNELFFVVNIEDIYNEKVYKKLVGKI